LLKVTAVAFIFCLFTVAAYSQTSGNAYIGYSYLRADLPGGNANLNGWNGSVEVKVLPFIGLVGDFSGNYGSQNFNEPFFGTINTSVAQHNFLFGPRVSFKVGKFRPFLHGLIGASHISESGSGFSNSDTSFADALGGGIDYHLIPLISWRLQIDALQTRFASATQEDIRVSTGIVIHF
jgi:Outer membrane protein beta-barrel domain